MDRKKIDDLDDESDEERVENGALEVSKTLQNKQDEIEIFDLEQEDVAAGETSSQGANEEVKCKAESENLEHEEILKETKAGNLYVPTSKSMPFLGGYHNELLNTDLVHAAVQTRLIQTKFTDPKTQNTRDTQTTQVKNKVQQTTKDQVTQMTKIGIYISTRNDKYITPRPYVTADELHEKFIEKVIVVQKYIRRHLAKRRIGRLLAIRQAHWDWFALQEQLREEENVERMQNSTRRKENPRSKNDFNLLYNAIENWRKREIERIEATVSGPERKAALCLLFERESVLLTKIHNLKLMVSESIKQGIFMNQLRKMSAAKRWHGYKGHVQVYTESILWAKHLQDLYHTLTLDYLSQEQKLDVLRTLKETIKPMDSKLTREILDLVDREADLLIRGMQVKHLTVLHQRILLLFKEFIRTPSYNAQMDAMIQEAKKNTRIGEWLWCEACGKCFPPEKFGMSSSSSQMKRCETCLLQQNIAHQRTENTIYIDLLVLLQTNERKLHAKQSAAYLLEITDFRYLIEVIWLGKSALSAHTEISALVMCRWDKNIEWSPWNCILLTSEEARFHNNVESVEDTYEPAFIEQVEHRHLAAKKYFRQLPNLATRFALIDPDGIMKKDSRPVISKECSIKVGPGKFLSYLPEENL